MYTLSVLYFLFFSNFINITIFLFKFCYKFFYNFVHIFVSKSYIMYGTSIFMLL